MEQPDGRTLPVDRLAAGQYFGEMALVGRGRRRATVRAADEPLSVVALDEATFGQLVAESPGLRAELEHIIDLRQAQSQVRALAELARDEAGREALRRLAEGAPTRQYAPGETIIRQGDLGESFYFVLEGAVEVFIRRGQDEALIDRHGPGAFFGELALLGDRRRTATVRAAGPLAPGERVGERVVLGARVLELDAAAFEALRGLSGRFATEVDAAAAERQLRIRN